MAHGVIRAPSPATGSKVAVHMGDPTIPIGIERWQNATADNQQKTLSRAAFCRPVSFSILPMPEPHSPIAPALLFWKECEYNFWGQDIAEETQYRANRGCDSARKWGFCHAQLRDERLGFRPVLDPMDMVHLDEVRIGEQLRIWGGQNIVSGRLEEINDYEVVLSGGDGALDSSFGIRLNDGSIVVERSVIVGVQTKQKEET